MKSPDSIKSPDKNGPADGTPAIEAEIQDARERVASSMRTLSDEVARRTDWAEQVRAHPVAALAVALGGGYVVGGGLFTALTFRLLRGGLRLGVQLALLPALEREVTELAAKAGEALGGSGSHQKGVRS